MLSPMIDVASDFPFVADLPKREKSRVVKLWDAFHELAAMHAEHGLPVPRSAAADLLEVSQQRIAQLIAAGKLTVVDFNGHSYVTEKSLKELAKTERKTGRPFKGVAESNAEIFKLSVRYAKDAAK